MEERNAPIGRGIYLLPNLFTTASLFAAFYAMVAATKLHFETAVIAIFIGLIADGLDGRIARLTNTQTAFGAEYDSLSDMVTFGVAPSLLAYTWILNELGKLGWLIAFVFTASVALRLARFNTQLAVADKRYFQGLPCPPGASILISLVWIGTSYDLHTGAYAVLVAAVTLAVAILMVSNIRYYSFKEIGFKGKIPFIYVLIIVLLFAAIAINPAIVLLSGFAIYGLSGPFLTLMHLRKMRKMREDSHVKK